MLAHKKYMLRVHKGNKVILTAWFDEESKIKMYGEKYPRERGYHVTLHKQHD